MCYHSKFIFRDRSSKERQILDAKPRLLIATQVVEVSLELDYDVMHTECAAFDALRSGPGESIGFVETYRGELWSIWPNRAVTRSTISRREF